jgi:hypothetical protein
MNKPTATYYETAEESYTRAQADIARILGKLTPALLAHKAAAAASPNWGYAGDAHRAVAQLGDVLAAFGDQSEVKGAY